jgi:DNA-binding transcriptional MerR regulator
LAGVTVRTLHHYDRIGLVVPAGRTAAGYRTYRRAEIERLQEVLFFRQLGLALEEIKRIVEQPTYSRVAALRRQRELLEARAEHVFALIDTIDRAIRAETEGTTMTNEEMLEVFGDFDPAEYDDEARDRWGGTAAYRESARRTSGYTKQDWEAVRAESEAISQRFLALMAAGDPPDSDGAIDTAEEHRSHISRWFYDCPKEMHVGLGQMYVADPRFKENIDKAGAGLADYMAAAIAANAQR